jgi:hypothetical protein
MRDVYYIGEKPGPEAFEVRREKGGQLVESFNGWTFVLFFKNGTQGEVAIPCTNNNNGSGSITWPTPSCFVEKGTADCFLRADDGAGGHIKWVDRFTVHVKERV